MHIQSIFYFSFIIYHMITYMCGGVIIKKIQLGISTLTGWITRLHNKSQHHDQQFQLQDNIRNSIPEVAFDYSKFREPLIGQDLYD